MKLPTIESSFVMHSTRTISGFNRPEHPAIRVTMEVLNATESYLWVSWPSVSQPSRLSPLQFSVISEDLDLPMELMSPWILKQAYYLSPYIE